MEKGVCKEQTRMNQVVDEDDHRVRRQRHTVDVDFGALRRLFHTVAKDDLHFLRHDFRLSADSISFPLLLYAFNIVWCRCRRDFPLALWPLSASSFLLIGVCSGSNFTSIV